MIGGMTDEEYRLYADSIQRMREILLESEIGEVYATGEVPDVRIDEGAELSFAVDDPDTVEALRRLIEEQAQKLADFADYEAACVPPPSGCTLEEWREAARLDVQRAAARANAYGRRWAAEKAREIMRRRKWKKSINARGALSGFSG